MDNQQTDIAELYRSKQYDMDSIFGRIKSKNSNR
ncbi:Uncharacterised protein [Psychrobacter phenylpyruvicus]|uniref:Uncharacterized protein n=1 Tax=Psychrobacter phenylpyruvicus TaxID=29432 RepID=A0A379LMV6_9GAMM|nr:Uncharacterised protein [Psychrobacter phenylpyruvicus]